MHACMRRGLYRRIRWQQQVCLCDHWCGSSGRWGGAEYIDLVWQCIVFLSSRVFSQAFAWLINDLVLLLVSCPSFIRGAKMHSERYMPVSYTEVATHAVICMHAAIRLQLVICSNDFIVRSSSWSQSSGYLSHRSCIYWYVLSSRDFRSSFCLTLWSCSVIVWLPEFGLRRQDLGQMVICSRRQDLGQMSIKRLLVNSMILLCYWLVARVGPLRQDLGQIGDLLQWLHCVLFVLFFSIIWSSDPKTLIGS